MLTDAVKELHIGMEGHGSWRTQTTACQPGMQYQRDYLVCVCGDDGNWPNPLCRDVFRVLHDVDDTYRGRPALSQKCATGKLYLFDCNVCVCPLSEHIDSRYCTKKNCSDNDPVLDETPYPFIENDVDEISDVDIYAECHLNRKYKFGCRKCTCQRNNRLLCDKCTTVCSDITANEVFNVDCNSCVCDKGKTLCTTKKCLKQSEKPQLELSKHVDMVLRSVDSPVDNMECIPGTKYNKDCNTCYCTENKEGEKSFSCTLQSCDLSSSTYDVTKDCVENTVYESNCLRCRCDVIDGIKRESCVVNSVCSGNETRDNNLESLHGYCEPSHEYSKDCNQCTCMSNGKTVLCSSKICKKKKEPVIVDIIPVSQKGGTNCPKHHMYKVDCNYCFCLSNGNVLCTTSDCNKPLSD